MPQPTVIQGICKKVKLLVMLLCFNFVLCAQNWNYAGVSDFQVALAEQRTAIQSANTDILKSQAYNTYISILIDGGWYNTAEETLSEASTIVDEADCSKELAVHKANHALLQAYHGESNSDQLFSEALYCAQNLKSDEAISYVLYRMIQAAQQGGYFGTSFQSVFQLEQYATDNNSINLDEIKLLEAYSLAHINKQDQAIQLLNTLTELSPLSILKKHLWLVDFYLAKGDQLNVKTYVEKVDLLATELNSPYWLIQSQYAYGKGLIAENDFDGATDIFNQTIALIEELNHPISTSQELMFKIDLAKEQKDIATVISLCSALIDDSSIWAALSVEDKQFVYTSQKDAYMSNGNTVMAQSASIQLELLSKESAAKSISSYYEFLKNTLVRSQNEKENITTQAENEISFQEQRTEQVLKYSALGALLVLSILLILLYRQIRIKQSANAELEERSSLINKQNQELRKMNSVLEESRQQAEAGSVAKSNFLAVTSHEIRTPMNGIMGMASLLLESKMDEEQRKYVETIQTSSENLLTILNDILDFSKIEAGKMNIETTMIDLNKLLDEVMIIFSKQAKDKNIELTKFIGNAMIKQFRGDILRIRQVLINLVSNAIKFTENGTVKILVELDELLKAQNKDSRIAKLKFSVIDDGIGISEEKQKKIFESFEQEDSSTSRKYGGIGLGLSISKKLVELMGGEIGLSSEKGSGTSFYFTLNVEIPNSASKKTIPLSHREDGTEIPVVQEPISVKYPLRILLAEDNPFNKLFIDKLFEKFGYTDYLHAENGLEVLEKLESNDVDLILMDIQMPEMDGLEATQKIIERYGNRRPVIIALTADANDSSKDQYLNAGMDGFLSKPFKAEDLQQLLVDQSNKINTLA